MNNEWFGENQTKKSKKHCQKQTIPYRQLEMKGRICNATDPFDHCVSHLLYSVFKWKHKTHK